MTTEASDNTEEAAPFAEQTVITDLLGDHPKVKILSVLSNEPRDTSVSQIAEQSGVSRSTVYDHLDDLQALDVVKQTRELGGSPLYEINKDDEAAKRFAQLQWAVVENAAEE